MAQNVGQQVRSNAVALISLAVALTALSYNTWRNERTEHNRNIRVAAFEVLAQGGAHATALLASNPSPTEDEVRIGLSGNLCRCTGYDGIVKAVLSVSHAG